MIEDSKWNKQIYHKKIALLINKAEFDADHYKKQMSIVKSA